MATIGELRGSAESRALTSSYVDAVIAHMQQALKPQGHNTAIASNTAELVDTIRALEKLVCVATAAQAALTGQLDEAERERQAAAGVPQARQGRGVASLVGFARRESPNAGHKHLGLAKVVATEMPHTWAAWQAGVITEWKATLIARETACLDLELRQQIDELVAGDQAKLEGIGPRELVGQIVGHAARLDPAAVTARRRYAERERNVSLRPAPDSMTWLTALLPVAAGVATYAALTQVAATAKSAGDQRSRGQIMADTLVERTTGHEPVAIPVQINLVVTDRALFSLPGEGDPCSIGGFGPVPNGLARELIQRAGERNQRTWLRRLYANPTSGDLVAMDSTRRRFPAAMARFVRIRDQICRTPWCEAPIRQIDHIQPYAEGGPTSLTNAQGLCEACNRAKQAHGWRARPGPDGSVITYLPTGHRTVSGPYKVITASGIIEVRLDYDDSA